MSTAAIAEIHAAVQALVEAKHGAGLILTDWFVGYGTTRLTPDTPSAIAHTTAYATSEGSVYGAYGVANMALEHFSCDLNGG